eukprot:6199322-Pleurochrysis_carterae.AAC.2
MSCELELTCRQADGKRHTLEVVYVGGGAREKLWQASCHSVPRGMEAHACAEWNESLRSSGVYVHP